VSGSFDNTIRVWNIKTGECEKILEGHTDRVHSVALSPNGRTVISGSKDKAIRAWNITSKSCEKIVTGHTGDISSLAFSTNSTLLASAAYRSIRLWNAQTGLCEKELLGHTGTVLSVLFSPDDALLASGSEDKTIRIWNVKTGVCEKTLTGHTSIVYFLKISPDGSILLSGSADKTVRMWNIQSGVCEMTLVGVNTYTVDSVAFSPDSTLFACGSSNQNDIDVWSIETGKCEKTLRGHTDNVLSFAFSRDGSALATSSNDRTIRTWDMNASVCFHVYAGDERSQAGFPDGSRVKFIENLAFSPDNRFHAEKNGKNLAVHHQAKKVVLFRTGGGPVSVQNSSCMGLMSLPEQTKTLMGQKGARFQ
jgi:WD40 repeat protein